MNTAMYALKGKHVYIHLPTGLGKTMAFFGAIHALRLAGCTKCAWIISPLIALMVDQYKKASNDLNIHNFRLGVLGTADDMNSRCQFDEDKLDIVWMSPEYLMEQVLPKKRDKKVSEPSIIIIDECHFIFDAAGYRPHYSKLANLRVRFPSCQFIVCSGSLTMVQQNRISTTLGHAQGTINWIRSSIDRRNLFYSVQERKMYTRDLNFIVKALRVGNSVHLPAIIFVKDKTAMDDIYNWIGKMVKEKRNQVCLFHGSLSLKAKELIIHRLTVDLDVQVVVATSALGVGVDPPSIRSVIIYGPPDSWNEMIQSFGRGGRDSLTCKCYLFVKEKDINDKDDKDLFIKLLKKEQCLRRTFLEPYETINTMGYERCCAVCSEDPFGLIQESNDQVKYIGTYPASKPTKNVAIQEAQLDKANTAILTRILRDIAHNLACKETGKAILASRLFPDKSLQDIAMNAPLIVSKRISQVTSNPYILKYRHKWEAACEVFINNTTNHPM
jgi:superfamily II DNA helicase RecQ